ncbi:hypothetical protein ELY33_14640 [Vreelandella andesensis]|uniref:Uncharacterized protein n=1 Tax=Vreelandella andesensis TaxID=447567 RepID=A0A433KGM9_9GAMM|nr:hypothetical protein [Halomonas andesensis]RUR27828.1 hypothetical protein ELY33_14640 [Halomonas andesensis]
MDIYLQPLPNLTFTIKSRMATQSTLELLNLTENQNYQRAALNGDHNILLTHPPILLVHEGGGQSLVNRMSLQAQLKFSKKSQKNNIHLPSSLIVYYIDEKTLNGDLIMLAKFLFGPIQRLNYAKKDSKGRLIWKKIINDIFENTALNECIENTLLNGDELSVSHLKKLLSFANLSDSSIAHELGHIKKKTRNLQLDTNKSNDPNNSIMTPAPNNQTSLSSNARNKRNEQRAIDIKETLSNIKRAAEKAEINAIKKDK